MKKTILFCIVFLFCSHLFAQDPSKWTPEQVKDWYNKREWAKGCPYDLDDSIDKQKFAISYFTYQKQWDEVFSFWKENNLQNLELKRYEIGDRVFANVSDSPTRDYAKTNCEFHLKVIDIQFVVRGVEGFGISHQLGSKIVKPYDTKADIMLIQPFDEKIVASTPNRFFVFFPGDPHRPCIKIDENSVQVKKIVVKIKTE